MPTSSTDINITTKILWLTGNSGSGKTTLARILRKRLNAILLDGDEMRSSISEKAGFSREDREEHNLRIAKLAKILQSQGFHVIISVIAPFRDTRDKINNIIRPVWIYVKRELPADNNKPYEVPKNPYMIIDTDKLSIDESIEKIWEKMFK